MNNIETYTQIFIKTLEIKEQQTKGLKYQGIDQWDSVGHMTLISAIEDAFDIAMEADDIIEFNSFEKGIELLKKYNIRF